MKKGLKKSIPILTVISFLLMTVASSGQKPMPFTKEGGQIPPEFGIGNDTLLVVSHGDDWGYNKFLKKHFKENYFGNYKIITEQELVRYPADKYRFVFDHSLNYSSSTRTSNSNGNTPGYSGTTVTTTRTSSYASSDVFFVTDRKTNTDYVTKSSAFYSKLMRAYIKALEAVRKK